MEKTDTRATAFGRVVGALMEARGIPAEPEEITALAERSGHDGEKFLARVASGDGPDLGGLAQELRLSEREMQGLAGAYAFEGDPACAVPGCARPAQVGNGLGDCEEHRAEYAPGPTWRRGGSRGRSSGRGSSPPGRSAPTS